MTDGTQQVDEGTQQTEPRLARVDFYDRRGDLLETRDEPAGAIISLSDVAEIRLQNLRPSAWCYAHVFVDDQQLHGEAGLVRILLFNADPYSWSRNDTDIEHQRQFRLKPRGSITIRLYNQRHVLQQVIKLYYTTNLH